MVQTMEDVAFISLREIGVGDGVIDTLIDDHILIQEDGEVHMSKLKGLPRGSVQQAKELILNSIDHVYMQPQSKSLISDVVSQASYLSDRIFSENSLAIRRPSRKRRSTNQREPALRDQSERNCVPTLSQEYDKSQDSHHEEPTEIQCFEHRYNKDDLKDGTLSDSSSSAERERNEKEKRAAKLASQSYL